MERIVRVAIKKDGMIYIGEEKERHHHVIRRMIADGVKAPINRRLGFLTSDIRFVGRGEAYQIAWLAGQINHLSAPPGQLFSEDVW